MAPKRSLLTLDQVREQVDVNDYKTSKPIDFASNKNRFEHDGDEFLLVTGKKEKMITKSGMTNLMHAMRLPPSLPKRLEAYPDILQDVVNRVSDRSGMALRTLSRRSAIMSFLEGDHTLISNAQLLDATERALKEPLFDGAVTTEDGRASFAVVSESVNPKLLIGKKDKFLGGVRMENNPLRASSTKIEAYLERLVCLNGQISSQAIWTAPRSIDDDVGDWLNMNIGHAAKESEKMFDSISKLAGRKIDAEMSDFLENIYEQLKVPEKVRDLITRRIHKEGCDTLYDLFNHITYVASNYRKVRDDADLSARIMRIGGHFAEHIDHTCRSCNRPSFATAE